VRTVLAGLLLVGLLSGASSCRKLLAKGVLSDTVGELPKAKIFIDTNSGNVEILKSPNHE